MLGAYRKEYLIRIVLMTAMVWGFALPVVHLVCGMTIERQSVLCDGHDMEDGPHESSAHSGHASEGDAFERHSAEGYTDDVASQAMALVSHHDSANVGMVAMGHEPATRDDDFAAPTTTVEAREDRVECCWIDTNAVDRRAPLPSLTQVPDLAVSHSDVATIYDLPEVRPTNLAAEDDPSPPVAFRLLFSVFLI